MKATEILMNEHRVIERVLDALQTAAQVAAKNGVVRPAFFSDASDFIRGFADGCHHHKEEGVLFQKMVAGGLPAQGGPVGVMLHEHELGRQYTRAMHAAAERWQQGADEARQDVVSNALGYVTLLRQHISKEDHILFPMADRVIPVDEHSLVLDGFDKVEHEETGEGVHEKYLALAERLAVEAAGLSIEESIAM
jgi:hemerythrin-like domain-containing protein